MGPKSKKNPTPEEALENTKPAPAVKRRRSKKEADQGPVFQLNDEVLCKFSGRLYDAVVLDVQPVKTLLSKRRKVKKADSKGEEEEDGKDSETPKVRSLSEAGGEASGSADAFAYYLHYKHWSTRWDEWVRSDCLMAITDESRNQQKELKRNEQKEKMQKKYQKKKRRRYSRKSQMSQSGESETNTQTTLNEGGSNESESALNDDSKPGKDDMEDDSTTSNESGMDDEFDENETSVNEDSNMNEPGVEDDLKENQDASGPAKGNDPKGNENNLELDSKQNDACMEVGSNGSQKNIEETLELHENDVKGVSSQIENTMDDETDKTGSSGKNDSNEKEMEVDSKENENGVEVDSKVNENGVEDDSKENEEGVEDVSKNNVDSSVKDKADTTTVKDGLKMLQNSMTNTATIGRNLAKAFCMKIGLLFDAYYYETSPVAEQANIEKVMRAKGVERFSNVVPYSELLSFIGDLESGEWTMKIKCDHSHDVKHELEELQGVSQTLADYFSMAKNLFASGSASQSNVQATG